MLLFFFLFLLNLSISYWNARAVGKAWVETKHVGGWPHLVAWMGAIMAASGFTWCYLVILVLAAVQFKGLEFRCAEAALDLGYLLVLPGFLFSGLMITLDGWARVYRQHALANVGTALYDTFAQIYNTYHAIDGVGDALTNVTDFFFRDRGDSSGGEDGVIVLVALVSAGVGILTTAVIINRVAGSEEPQRLKTRQKRGGAPPRERQAHPPAPPQPPVWIIGGALVGTVALAAMSCVAAAAILAFLTAAPG